MNHEQETKNLEKLWNQILSRDEILIREAFSGLDDAEREAVINHLKRMSTEEDWHQEQRTSAQAAIKTLLID
jgi:hypothetical protein